MNATYRVPTRFAPESRFPVTPVTAPPFRAARTDQLEQLKVRLLRGFLAETTNPAFYAPLRRAANDAVALAAATSFPLLVLPILFEEKAASARHQAVKQDSIQRLSRAMLVEVA